MFRMIIMTLSLIAVVLMNAVANILPLNGKTTGEIANQLPVLFIPAGYVFIIWAVIYVLLACWLFGFNRNRNDTNRVVLNLRGILFSISCLFNIAWILLWHFRYFDWTIIIMVSLLLTLLALYFTYPKKDQQFLGRLPIAVYLGWIFVATIANISYVLTLHEWSGLGLSDPLWTVLYLTFATAIALHFLYHHADIALNLVFMWTFIGVAVKNGINELFVSSAALFLTAVIGTGCFLIRKAKNKHL